MTLVRKLFVAALLLHSTYAGAASQPLVITFPDTGTYTYWVQGKSGAVTVTPQTSSQKQSVTIKQPVTDPSTLFVLSIGNGDVAQQLLAKDSKGVLAPVTLYLTDFHPIASQVVQVGQDVVSEDNNQSTPQAFTPSASPPPPAPAKQGNGFERLLSLVLSLIVAGIIIAAITWLVKLRGAPLIGLARKAGVDVPDPAGISKNDPEPPVYTSKRRGVEVIPDEAGVAPVAVGLTRGAMGSPLSIPDAPQFIGIQGPASGKTFKINAENMSVGRDSDNQIVLPDNTVSRRHVIVSLDRRGRVTMSDTGSSNGVYVNGGRVQRAILADGDEVKIGDNYFRFVGII